MFEEAILKSALNFGVFPAVTIYLMFVIIKDFRSDLTNLQNIINKQNIEIIDHMSKIDISLQNLIEVNEQMQNFINTYLNNLLLKLLDVLQNIERGNKND